MRRLVVAAFAVVLALTLTGCGGGGGAAQTPAAAPATTTAAPAAVAGAPSSTTLGNRSANETETFVPFPTADYVPAELKQKITVDKQPTLIYFFDSGQKTSTEVREMIDTVRHRNSGMVDLVAYDLSKYVTVNPDGSMNVDQALSADEAHKQVVQFARDPVIGVTFTPFIVLTDGQGYIIYKHSGLADTAFLEREVQRAAR